MKNYALILLLVALAIAQENYSFEQYIKDFGKNYINDEEYAYRKHIFESKLKTIQDSNKEDKGYILNANQFTDRSEEEIKTFLTPSFDPTKKASPRSSIPLVGAPTSWDWREYSKVTPIKVQGSCGSCWAFSSVAAFESLLLIKTGQSYDLSEEYVVECAGAYSSCYGGYVTDADILLEKSGAPL